MYGDLKVLNEHLYGTTELRVEDRTTSTNIATVKQGEICNKGASGAVAAAGNFAVLGVDAGAGGLGQDGTDLLIGVCKEESDETSTVDGHGVFYLIGLGTRLVGKATTYTNMDTVADLDGLVLDNVTLDGITAATGNTTTTPYTIDENDTDDPNVHAFQILTGDIVAGTLEVRVVAATCMLGNGI